jgi:hypothetical protein
VRWDKALEVVFKGVHLTNGMMAVMKKVMKKESYG